MQRRYHMCEGPKCFGNAAAALEVKDFGSFSEKKIERGSARLLEMYAKKVPDVAQDWTASTAIFDINEYDRHSRLQSSVHVLHHFHYTNTQELRHHHAR